MITSKSNEYIKHVKSLSQKKYRDEFKEFIVEGFKMVKEAISENMQIQKIIISEDFHEKIGFPDIEIVSDEVFAYISDTKTPQGILAIVHQKEKEKISGDLVFALDRVQDPGNVGTIIRTLDAAGVKDLIVSAGCADVYNPKVVRSTMGGIFRINIVEEDNIAKLMESCKKQGYQIVVTSLETDDFIYDINFHAKQLIIIGNESQGVSEELIHLANRKVKIPMPGRAESLNASVAASIVAFEAVRQKTCG